MKMTAIIRTDVLELDNNGEATGQIVSKKDLEQAGLGRKVFDVSGISKEECLDKLGSMLGELQESLG